MLGMPDALLKKADPPIDRTLILLCEKCGRKLSKSGDCEDNAVGRLQKALKADFSDAGEKKSFRATVTTCMNLCPEGAVAVALVSTGNGSGATEFFELDLNDAREAKKQLLDRIRRR